MIDQKIFAKLEHQPAFDKLNLAIVFGLSQFDLILCALKCSSFNFLLIVKCSPSEQYRVMCDYEIPSNIQIIFDLNSVYMILSRAQILLTTVAHFSPTLPPVIYRFFKAASDCCIPIVEVPHGLYQWGYGFIDNSKIVNAASFVHGMGVRVDSFADFQIDWFGNDGVGYPRFHSEASNGTQLGLPDYTLITSNLNWYMHSYADQRILIDQVVNYASDHEDELFIWKSHPAERHLNVLEAIQRCSPGNLFIYGLSYGFYFHGIDSAEKLIANCSKAITTVSTCFADYQVHQKPVAVYSCAGLESIIETCDEVSVFSSRLTLSDSSFSKLDTGRVHPFSVSKFDAILDGVINSGFKGGNVKSRGILEALSS